MKKTLSFIGVIVTILISLCLVSCGDIEIEQEIEYSIYVLDNSNVDVVVQQKAKAGTEIKISATPKEGYYLECVKVNNDSLTSLTFIMPECDVLLDVKVVNGKESYSVNATEYENGTIFTLTERARFGEEVKVRIFPNEGYIKRNS